MNLISQAALVLLMTTHIQVYYHTELPLGRHRQNGNSAIYQVQKNKNKSKLNVRCSFYRSLSALKALLLVLAWYQCTQWKQTYC